VSGGARIPVPALVGEAAPHTPWGAPPAGYAGPRRSLVLSGGGIRLSYQAGVLRALDEAGLCFHHVDATSGGALNAAMLFSGLRPTEMCRRWSTLDVWDTVSALPPLDYFHEKTAVAAGSTAGMLRKTLPHLGIDPARIRAARGVEGTFNVLDYTTKQVRSVSHTEIDAELLVASMSLPGVLPPLKRDGTLYLDAAFVLDANPLEAVRRGADEIWLVWCLGNTGEYRGGPLNLYVQMLEMAANGGLIRDFERIADINRRIEGGEPVFGRTTPVKLHLVHPATPLPLDPDLYTGRVTSAQLVEMGYADAKRYLAARTEAGLPFRPEILMQTTPSRPGVTFRETMKGAFALGPTDPQAGKAAGKSAGTELAMHATVTVRDIDRFIADPEHLGGLVGTIDFAPFGTAIPTGEGVFNLFSPAEDPATKLMVYELPFTHEGVSYYLAGKKIVKDDPGFDLWKDTTTLFTQLHRGTDKTGPVVGAGVLTLGVVELAKMVSGMHAIDADSVGAKAEALAKFGKFFAGELWEQYAHLAPAGA